jgi:hypothetical protein
MLANMLKNMLEEGSLCKAVVILELHDADARRWHVDIQLTSGSR